MGRGAHLLNEWSRFGLAGSLDSVSCVGECRYKFTKEKPQPWLSTVLSQILTSLWNTGLLWAEQRYHDAFKNRGGSEKEFFSLEGLNLESSRKEFGNQLSNRKWTEIHARGVGRREAWIWSRIAASYFLSTAWRFVQWMPGPLSLCPKCLPEHLCSIWADTLARRYV